LTDDELGLADREDNDGGGYMIEFVVYLLHPDWAAEAATTGQQCLFNMAEYVNPDAPERSVASFRFQADMEGAG
jgi:hypothetical protein